ncbi:MAG: ATP-dependent helicase [Thermoplasmata archaeon]
MNSTLSIGIETMITRVTEEKDKEEILDLMEPLIAEWFDNKFDALTEPQGYAIPLIHEGKNVLVSSPTGSGKTLTAFLSIINELYKLDKQDELEDKIYCVYVSPLKALANDIHKNLEEPLDEIKELAEEKDMKIPDIRTATRSGDTSQKERRKMAKNPPHIFITTPESLGLVLSSPKFREKFDEVQYFINDEIHEISSSKRGVFLSLNTERLEDHVQNEMTRIGLSATQAPIEEIAKYLGGYENGKPRPVNIIEVMGEKRLDLSVISPVEDMTLLPYEIVNSRMYDKLKEMVLDHRTTLIFTNTRSGAENVAYKLKDRGIEDIAAHHGSLSKDTRLDVEDSLKYGELEAAVSSTSLELGIDVGYIDLVVQVGSPKNVAKGLQRVGRAGHSIGETSKGRMIVFEKDDLVECTVLTYQAYQHEIDRVNIPTNNLDVLAQAIIGMSIEHRWDVDEAYELVKKAYCYQDLPKKDFLNVLDYLGGTKLEKVYPKIWYNEDEGVIGKKGGSQMLYYMNIGTIPSDSSYRVYSDKGVPLGTLSEKFVERLAKGDVFVLGSHSYEFLHTRGTKVFVKDASGKKPTVPSWSGEMLPRSFDLSVGIGRFRRKLAERINDDDVLDWLMEDYHIDKGSAQTIVSYIKEQMGVIEELPTDRRLLVEGHIDQDGKYNLIFHACFGRRTNDALSRAFAYKISKKYNCNTNVSVTDDNFMITVPKKIAIDEVVDLVNYENVEETLKSCVKNTELFKQRFRHCASRALMILRNYKGRDISVSKQKLRSRKILDRLHSVEDFPIVKETYNEILYQVLDLKHAKEVLKWIDEAEMDVHIEDYDNTPSPFAHNVIMVGVSDVIMMEDKSALLRQFHQKVLEQVIPKEEIEKFKFESEVVEEYYFDKKPEFSSKEEMPKVIKKLQPLHVLNERGNNIFTYTDKPFETVRKWSKGLLNEGKIQSIWVGDVKYVLTQDLDLYLHSLDQGEQPHGSTPVIESLKEGTKTKKQIYEETDLRLKDIDNIIRDMERKRLVTRKGITDDGKYRYALLEKKDTDLESVERIISSYLEYEAPRSLEEIAYALNLGEDVTQKALNNLVEQNKMVSGRLVMGEGEQYMPHEDYQSLRFPEGEHVSEEKIAEYKAEKQFGKVGSIEEYFELFTEASMPYDVFHRVENFSLDKWKEMRDDGKIVEGRFIKGKVRYAFKNDIPLFVGAYREETDLNEEERNILHLIQSGEARTLRQIKKKSDLKNDRVKEIVKQLDKNLYIIREYTGKEGWSAKNKYRAIDIEPVDKKEAKKRMIRRFIKGNGPISFSDLRYQTGFNGREVESVLSQMIHEGEVTKIQVGSSSRELYLLQDEADILKEVLGNEHKKVRILSKRDPYTRPMWAEIYSRYGDDWVFPIVKGGEVKGGIERWKMSGCIEIRHLDLDDESCLDEALEAIDEMMEYHNLEGYDIVRIKNYQNKNVSTLTEEKLSVFFDHGYDIIQGMLVKGNIIKDVFEEENLINYVLYRQKVFDGKYSDPKAALNGMKGLRSDFELRPRVDEFYSVDWLFRRGEVYAGKMIPPYYLYALPRETSIYKTAKDVGMDSVMDTVLKIINENQPVPKRTIYHQSPYSTTRTKEAIDDLYEGLVIVRDHENRYVLTPPAEINPWNAKKEVVKWAFENFGVFSAERLSGYLGIDFPMAELRKILSELVEEDLLVKGFLKRNDETVYWMLNDGLDKIEEINFDDSFVLSTKDRLNLYFRDEIKDKFDLGTCHLIFQGPEMAAAFTAKISDGLVNVKKFEGPKRYKKIIREWAYDHNMGVRINKKNKKKRVSDYEIRKWYESTRGI